MKYTLSYIGRKGKQVSVIIEPQKNRSLYSLVSEELDKNCQDEERLFTLDDQEGNTIMTEEDIEEILNN